MRSAYIVGLGGTTRPGSSCEQAVRLALLRAKALGADTEFFNGEDLTLPVFSPGDSESDPKVQRLISTLRRADGIIIASPGYHGSVSGLIKNALDYTEYMRNDPDVYFDGRAVGTIVCAAGWQTIGTTLTTLRSIIHALRGWPTPLGVGLNTSIPVFHPDGTCIDDKTAAQLRAMADQVVEFANQRITTTTSRHLAAA